MAITALSAWWFLPFVVPICLYVAYTDMAQMRITNQSVLALGVVFCLFGLIALPFDVYLWRLVQLVVVLIVGFVLNMGGVMGAGDSKFIAAAAPFIAQGDLHILMPLFAAVLLAAAATHRAVKHTPLRNLAPHWESWKRRKFPLGLALGPALALYLIGGAFYGA